MSERKKLEAAIQHADEVAQANLGTPCGEEHKDLHRWLSQFHASKFPLEDEEEKVIQLNDRRIRSDREFEDEQMLYIEILWGKETFAYDVAIRDLEAMRQGREDPSKPLRPPETDYECELIIKHVRWFANEIARLSKNPELVRPDDDVAVEKS